MALNANENGGYEHLWKKWLWTPMKVMALNAYESDGFECLQLWMPIVLNAYGQKWL